MSYAIYLSYTDQYGNEQPNICETGLQYVSEADSREEAHAEFCDDVGIDADLYGVDSFQYVQVPDGASDWSNERVNGAARKALA